MSLSRKTIIRLAIAGALILTFLVVQRCSTRTSPIGVWSSGPTELTFLGDGTAVMDTGTQTIELTWRALKNRRFILTTTGFLHTSFSGCFGADVLKLRSTGDVASYSPGPRGTPVRVTMGFGRLFTGPVDCEL